jgi:hypothetical protein
MKNVCALPPHSQQAFIVWRVETGELTLTSLQCLFLSGSKEDFRGIRCNLNSASRMFGEHEELRVHKLATFDFCSYGSK